MAISPLNRDAWNFHLADYLDRKFVDAILNIIDVGASIGHMGLPNLNHAEILDQLWTTVQLF